MRIFSAESKDWQNLIYEATGTLVVFHSIRDDISLLSNCGYIDLDEDAEYCWSGGKDCTEYCQINSISQFIDYIKCMDGYRSCLVDCKLGCFSKSELFWAIWSSIIRAPKNMKENDGSIRQEWGLHTMKDYRGHLTLQMPLIDYDMTEIWIDVSDDTTLIDALHCIAREMNSITSDLENIPAYNVYPDEIQVPPYTLDDLREKIMPNAEFGWLGE